MGSATDSRLRIYREAASLTQEQLAVKAGVTSKTVRDIEKGVRAPHNGTLLLLADALQVRPDDLKEAA